MLTRLFERSPPNSTFSTFSRVGILFGLTHRTTLHSTRPRLASPRRSTKKKRETPRAPPRNSFPIRIQPSPQYKIACLYSHFFRLNTKFPHSYSCPFSQLNPDLQFSKWPLWQARSKFGVACPTVPTLQNGSAPKMAPKNAGP